MSLHALPLVLGLANNAFVPLLPARLGIVWRYSGCCNLSRKKMGTSALDLKHNGATMMPVGNRKYT